MHQGLISYFSIGLTRAESKLVKYFSLTLFLLVLVYIAFALHLPVSIYSLAGHDDALFISHAISLVQGNWLGSYNQMILAKGAGFSIFLTINAALGLPITLSLALLHSFSTWLLISRLNKLGLSPFFSLTLFALILFNPQSFPTRVIRDDIYPALTLIIISGLIDIFLLKNRSLLKSFLYGGAIALFWMTREEGVWIFPGVSLFGAFISCFYIYNKKIDLLKNLLISATRLIGFSVAPILAVCTINWMYYGGFVVVDFKEPYFARSLSLLNSIEPKTRTPHVPVNEEQRKIAYRISPTFSTLRPYFENEGLHWTTPGCNVYKNTCGDYAGGWFMWAYRDAAAKLGMYSSFAQAKAFYKKINNEIEAACDSKVVTCSSGLLGFLPHLEPSNLTAIPASLLNTYHLLTYQSGLHMSGGPSMDANNILYTYRIFLGSPLSMPSANEQLITLKGWYYPKAKPKDWLSISCPHGSQEVPRLDSPDIIKAMKDDTANKQRFYVELFDKDNCQIKLESGANIPVTTLMDRRSGAIINDTQNLFYLDSARSIFPRQIMSITTLIKDSLGKLYSYIIPVLLFISCLALIGILIQLIKQISIFQPLLLIAIFAWILLFTRIIILVLIDVTSFPAINALYMGPGFPLSVLAMISTIASYFQFSAKPKAN